MAVYRDNPKRKIFNGISRRNVACGGQNVSNIQRMNFYLLPSTAPKLILRFAFVLHKTIKENRRIKIYSNCFFDLEPYSAIDVHTRPVSCCVYASLCLMVVRIRLHVAIQKRRKDTRLNGIVKRFEKATVKFS